MTPKRERGLWELAAQDPERLERELWRRRVSRRGLMATGGGVLGWVLGAVWPAELKTPLGWVPAALAQSAEAFEIPGKDGLVVLNDRPLNAETPPHLLDDAVTPVERHFVRNNGLPPVTDEDRDTGDWTLTVDGEVHRPLTLTFDQLKRFKTVTLDLVVECGGNGRAGFNPPAKGNQWTFGAVACARYTGVRLGEVLREAGLRDSAVYTGYYGRDLHLSGNPDKPPISRGTPIWKAVEEHTLLAWEMNGRPLPALHGFPVRVVTPGWPGSTSIKWLRRVWVRNRVHDGPKMNGYAYRLPRYPVEPGAKVPESDMKIIESMPVKSLITSPRTGRTHPKERPFTMNGHAWAGDRSVKALDVSIDFGATWIPAELKAPVNRYAWQHWTARFKFPTKGYYEVWARATDSEGVMQPMVVPGWNPKGYLNNAMHRIAVRVI